MKAYKIAVIESEKGWGRKIDDYMVCPTIDGIESFKKSYNAKNTSSVAPDWYMQAEGLAIQIDVTDKQYIALMQSELKQVWLSALNRI